MRLIVLSYEAAFIFAIVLPNFCSESTINKYAFVLVFDTFVDSNWTKDCFDSIERDILWHKENPVNKIAICQSRCTLDDKKQGSTLNQACLTVPVLIQDEIVNENKLKAMTYAQATMPCFVNLSTSSIPGAGRGIFAKFRLPKGFIVGPYSGVVIHNQYEFDGENARDSAYAWRVYYKDKENNRGYFFVDAMNESKSNWLRYINSARYEEEQNMYALELNESVYYMTYKDVKPNTELLAWYGETFARRMKINIAEGSNHDWQSGFAPKKEIVICNSCENLSSEDKNRKRASAKII